MIALEVTDHIAHVVLQTRTMTPAFFTRLGEVFEEVAQHDVRAVILRSDQKAFSYGLDLGAAFAEHGDKLMGSATAGPRFGLRDLIKTWQASLTAVAECAAPVICAVQSWCIGGGLDLASAADIRLASEDAVFSLREAQVAIVADLGSLQRLPPIIGLGRTKELAFTARDVGAAEALQMGLVSRVLPSHEALLEAANETAAQIAANAPMAVRGSKVVLDWGVGKTVAEGLDYVANWNSAFLATQDLGEAAAAFMERRPAKFTGK